MESSTSATPEDRSTWIRVDLHAHTWRSPDGAMSPRCFVEAMRRSGVQRAAVTDHGRIEGALEAQTLDPELVIVGEEIRCRCGTELIGLFLKERIQDGLPVGEAADRIRSQGGVVYAPHPYAYARRAGWRAGRALSVADVVEVFNGRAFLPAWNRAAERAAAAAGLPGVASSDAHFPGEIGRAYTLLPPFTGAESFLEAVRFARPMGVARGTPLDHLASTALWIGDRLGLRTRQRAAPEVERDSPAGEPASRRGERSAAGRLP